MRSLAVLVVALLFAGCSGNAGVIDAPTSTATAEELPTSAPSAVAATPVVEYDPGECDDTASCAAEFAVRGVRYGHGCTAARADALEDHSVGTTLIGGAEREVRRFRNVDPSLMVAVKVPGGACYEGEREILSDWTIGFGYRPPGEDPRVALDAVCTVAILTKAQTEASGCS